MNIAIDASTASPAALRLTAAILTFIAGFKENPQNANMPIPNVGYVASPVAPLRGTSPEAAAADEIPSYKSRSSVVPPAPPAPPAPSASENTGAPQGEAPGAELIVDGQVMALFDSASEKWNPEIHTANQSKNTDGTWRRKRTSKDAPAAPKTVELPKAQVPPPPPAPSTAVEPVKVVPTAPSAPAATPAAVVAPVAPTPPVSTASTSPLAELGGDTFAALVKFATNLVGAKKISTAALLEACADCGVPDLHACSKPENALLIPSVADAIAARLAK